MTMIGSIEAEIVSKLVAALTRAGDPSPQVDVQAWPQRPKDYRMTHPIGAALVIYHGANYRDVETAIGTHALLEASFEIGLMARSLRNLNNGVELGMYELIELSRNALMGWQPTAAAGAIAIKHDGFDDYHESVWQYHIKVSVPVVVVGSNNLGAMFGDDLAFGDAPPPIASVGFSAV